MARDCESSDEGRKGKRSEEESVLLVAPQGFLDSLHLSGGYVFLKSKPVSHICFGATSNVNPLV